MKKIIINALLLVGLVVGSINVQAQDTLSNAQKKNTQDHVMHKTKDSLQTNKSGSKMGVYGGFTFTRFDIGLTKLIDNGSLSLKPANSFLDYKPWKTSQVSFDVLQLGYRFSKHFAVYAAGGFDWTHIRLDQDITIQKNQALDNYVVENIHFSKNRFSASYVHIPLNFELRSNKSKSGRRFRFVVGPELAFLIDGKVKQVSAERGKTKVNDDFHFTPLRYGATARIGYGGMGFFVKYYANDMFDTPSQAGLKNMAFGLTFGLN